MADLSDKIDTTTAQLVLVPQPPNEHILCTIYVYSNGTIVLEPDFNNGKMAYIVETGNLNNEVYHYYLEHASISINMDDLIKERKLFNEVCLRQQALRAQIVGNDFDSVKISREILFDFFLFLLFKVPPSVLKLNVFGEIVSGKNFEYDDLYVYYSVDLSESKFLVLVF